MREHRGWRCAVFGGHTMELEHFTTLVSSGTEIMVCLRATEVGFWVYGVDCELGQQQ